MDLVASLLTFTMFWKLSWSLQCYTCDPEHTFQTCMAFDYSHKYMTQCNKSTMCFKRITSLDFGDGLTSHTVSRGCAPQTTSGEQRKVNGKWYAVKDIYEVYDETCSEDPSDAERSTKTIHCYCRGELCNSADKMFRNVLAIIAMAVTLIVLS
ncbi:hypothetical protein B5X24_HaOG207476 [Helicoverpa armigera]|nr:hypothetical protein B5X24_HaOG207476 [Helicoverpa armigera]